MDYIELIKKEKLYALYKTTAKDDIEFFCKKGELYKIIDYEEDDMMGSCFILNIRPENDKPYPLKIKTTDSDFEILIKP